MAAIVCYEDSSDINHDSKISSHGLPHHISGRGLHAGSAFITHAHRFIVEGSTCSSGLCPTPLHMKYLLRVLTLCQFHFSYQRHYLILDRKYPEMTYIGHILYIYLATLHIL